MLMKCHNKQWQYLNGDVFIPNVPFITNYSWINARLDERTKTINWSKQAWTFPVEWKLSCNVPVCLFLKNCSAVILWHPYQLKSSPSNLMVFLAQQILIWTVDLHGFLYNPIYKPTERNQAFQSQSTLCSRELAREGSCGTVRWSRACVSPVLWPALPPAASTSEEPEIQVPPAIKLKKTCSQDERGTQLCVSCDVSVTKSAGNFRLTNLFQNTLGFSLVFISVVVASPLPTECILKLRSHCFYYKSPKTRTSAITSTIQ